MNVYEIIRERLAQVAKMVAASGNSDLHVEESKLRIYQPIKNGKGQYIFDPKTTDVDNVTTFALNRNDVFVPFLWSFLLTLTHKETGVQKLYTFAPVNDGTTPSVFPVGFDSDNISKIYDGHVQWNIGSDVMYSAFPMEGFHKVPETQPYFLLSSSDEAVREGMLERSIEEDLALVMPRIIMAGTRDHKISVNFNASELEFTLAGEDATEWEAGITMLMTGALVKGGCQNGDQSPFGKVVGNW